MEDGLKGEVTKPAESKFIGKAGWVKKSTGKFLGSYKDRYILVDKTEIVIYEKEDLEKCIERVDLEKYDRCCGAKGPFQKKNRLVLIPAPKSKVHDVKLQVTNSEEKDAWIKALSDAISRAKNKIFDEVKVDESNPLEHVTRTRPKGNRSRRPPTRIHMKEVANVSSDGILRLDLDAVDSTPNGTYPLSEEAEVPKEALKPPMPPSQNSESQQEQQESSDETKTDPTVLKPPMPPSKDSKPTILTLEPLVNNEQDNTEESISITPPLEEEDISLNIALSPSSKDLQLPTPPPQDTKPTLEKEVLQSVEGIEEEQPAGKSPEIISSSSFKEIKTEESCASFAQPESSTPSEENSEPSLSDQEHLVPLITEQEPSGVLEESAPSEEENIVPSSRVSQHEDEQKSAAPPLLETLESSLPALKATEQLVEPAKKNPPPPAPPKKKPLKPPVITANVCDTLTVSPDSSASSKVTNVSQPDGAVISPCGNISAPEAKSITDSSNTVHVTEVTCVNTAEETVSGTEIVIQSDEILSAESTKGVVPSCDIAYETVLTASDDKDMPESEKNAVDSLKHKSENLVLVLSNYDTGDHLDFSIEQMDQEELRSSDSGQHSDDESENADNIRASTIALSGSRARLDEDISEDSPDFMDSHTLSIEQKFTNTVTQDKAFYDTLERDFIPQLSHSCEPLLALLPSLKRKSRSVGDLLSSTKPVEEFSPLVQSNYRAELHSKAGGEQNPGGSLNTQPEEEGNAGSTVDAGLPSGTSPQELLTEAMERLCASENVVRGASRMKSCTRRLSS
ncbi:pleckstrin homology domain-containing family O member 2-like [Arapaima gigas]